jgi:hypothetical protein
MYILNQKSKQIKIKSKHVVLIFSSEYTSFLNTHSCVLTIHLPFTSAILNVQIMASKLQFPTQLLGASNQLKQLRSIKDHSLPYSENLFN